MIFEWNMRHTYLEKHIEEERNEESSVRDSWSLGTDGIHALFIQGRPFPIRPDHSSKVVSMSIRLTSFCNMSVSQEDGIYFLHNHVICPLGLTYNYDYFIFLEKLLTMHFFPLYFIVRLSKKFLV